ncbi:MAG TPA: hypothetical protein QF753_01770 [Victivallales bacterium]|nr:hypothetical protein [Victivallales bacterium]
MRYRFIILAVKILFLFNISLNLSAEVTGEGFSKVPLRGNSLDIHFTNLTNATVKVEPFYYDNSKKVPDVGVRNLLFIPNSGKGIYKKNNMPIAFELDSAKIYSANKKYRLAAKKFIQGILVYNNTLSYRTKLKNYSYNNFSHFATYSSFMWSNGVETNDKGLYAFSNAMSEIDNLKYKFDITLADKRHLTFDLVFSTQSHLDTTTTSTAYSPYRLKLLNIADAFDQVAALTDLAGGILAIPLNPGGGALQVVSGSAWEVQALFQTAADNYVSYKTSQSDVGYSWLSSPFDILVYPKNYYLRSKNNTILAIPEFNEQKGNILCFLGNNSRPETIIIQFRSSSKGDLYINIISGTVLRTNSIEALEKTKEFQKITG